MTVRLDERHDAMLTRLAEAWGVSKNEAIARAVETADRTRERDAEIAAISREMADRWRPVLDRLGSV